MLRVVPVIHITEIHLESICFLSRTRTNSDWVVYLRPRPIVVLLTIAPLHWTRLLFVVTIETILLSVNTKNINWPRAFTEFVVILFGVLLALAADTAMDNYLKVRDDANSLIDLLDEALAES